MSGFLSPLMSPTSTPYPILNNGSISCILTLGAQAGGSAAGVPVAPGSRAAAPNRPANRVSTHRISHLRSAGPGFVETLAQFTHAERVVTPWPPAQLREP